MNRRDVLIGLGLAFLVPLALAAAPGCSSEGGSSGPSSPSSNFEVTSAGGFQAHSSTASAPGGPPHSHGLTILLADLANPPAEGVTYTTGAAEGHTHRVAFSRKDLADIQGGTTVARLTTIDLGHQHTFSIRKP